MANGNTRFARSAEARRWQVRKRTATTDAAVSVRKSPVVVYVVFGLTGIGELVAGMSDGLARRSWKRPRHGRVRSPANGARAAVPLPLIVHARGCRFAFECSNEPFGIGVRWKPYRSSSCSRTGL